MLRTNSTLTDSSENLELRLLEEGENEASGTTNDIATENDAVAVMENEEIRRPYLGLFCGAMSSLFFSLCSAIVKELDNISPFELAAFRFVGVLLPTIPYLIYAKQDPWPKGKRFMLLLRSILGALSLMMQFYAIRHMPLADASVIIFSVPVFVAVSARIFLKESCGVSSMISIALTMAGVLLIAKPPFLFHQVHAQDYNHETLWGAVAAFSGTLFAANVYVVLRLLKGLHWSVVLFNFSILAIIMTSCITWFVGDVRFPRCGRERYFVVALGAFSFGGQILLTLALKWEKAGPVAIARTADIVFAFIWQIIFFHEIPTGWSIAGALLVTSSVILTGVRKWVTSLPEAAAARHRLRFLTR